MASTKEAAPSVSGYFRELFESDHELLKSSSNAEILARWRQDHPGQSVTGKIRGSMANMKSQLRQKHGIPRKRRRRRGKNKEVVAVAKVAVKRVSTGALENLEGMIDSVLALAREHENAGLQNIVKHLRDARNGVVMRQS